MSKTNGRKDELTITRLFNAPLVAVWQAWSEPDALKRWWGPKTFTAPASRIDFRVGGSYLNCMRGPDGRDYWSKGVYREIVPMERIVYTDSFADEKGNTVPASHYNMPGSWPIEMTVSVTFDEQNGRTRMTLRHKGVPEGTMRELCETGWNESFDKLEHSVTKTGGLTSIIAEPGKQEIILTRVLDAPRDAVFKAYTDPQFIPRWWGPRRLTTKVLKMDVRPGGRWRIVQRDFSGVEFKFHGVYHDIRPPERLVYTFEFEGMPGHVSLETGTFDELEGGTLLTGKSVFQSVVDRDGMMAGGMAEGVSESMDRLAELLASMKTGKKAA